MIPVYYCHHTIFLFKFTRDPMKIHHKYTFLRNFGKNNSGLLIDWLVAASYRTHRFFILREKNPLPAKQSSHSFLEAVQIIRFVCTIMSASLPGSRDLPNSQYDLTTYWGRVRHAATISDPR